MTESLAHSIPQAVSISGLSRNTLYRAIAAGQLKARKNGARTLILAEDLKAWLTALPEYRSAGAGNAA